jgi:hypothetical protein
MSADNWTMCPRCKLRHEKKAQDARAAADAAYGKVSVEQWKDRDADAAKAAEPFTGTTFREDYELGVLSDGEFYVDYRGGCSVCGLSHSFKVSEAVEGVAQ